MDKRGYNLFKNSLDMLHITGHKPVRITLSPEGKVFFDRYKSEGFHRPLFDVPAEVVESQSVPYIGHNK